MELHIRAQIRDNRGKDIERVRFVPVLIRVPPNARAQVPVIERGSGGGGSGRRGGRPPEDRGVLQGFGADRRHGR